jgi:hypothetical protein
VVGCGRALRRRADCPSGLFADGERCDQTAPVAAGGIGPRERSEFEARVRRQSRLALDEGQRSARWVAGWSLLGASLLGGGASGLLAALGQGQNDAIVAGGLPTGRAIEDAAALGQRYNDFAWATGAFAVASFAVSLPLLITGRPTGTERAVTGRAGAASPALLAGAQP